MDLVGALRWSGRDRGVPELRRRQARAPRPHAVPYPRRCGDLRRPTATWALTTEDGTQLRSRFVVAATGVLSVPYWPSIPGRERYRGEAYHTGEWPKEPVDFAGKKVAVIGTGASAVQLIPEIAEQVAELAVYQRTPNWNSPLNNGKITDEEQAEIKATYDQIYDSCMGSFAGFVHRARASAPSTIRRKSGGRCTRSCTTRRASPSSSATTGTR